MRNSVGLLFHLVFSCFLSTSYLSPGVAQSLDTIYQNQQSGQQTRENKIQAMIAKSQSVEAGHVDYNDMQRGAFCEGTRSNPQIWFYVDPSGKVIKTMDVSFGGGGISTVGRLNQTVASKDEANFKINALYKIETNNAGRQVLVKYWQYQGKSGAKKEIVGCRK